MQTVGMEERNRYEERGNFEHELLNRRVTWFLSSQSILFAAYGLSFGDNGNGEVFRMITPIVGIAVSIVILIGITSSIIAKVINWKEFKAKSGEKEEPFGIKTETTVLGYTPDLFLPVIFAIAWAFLLCEIS